MATNANSMLEYESGVTPTLMSALTDSGDHTKFTSAVSLFSESDGNAPDVRPNGLITGGAVIPAAAAGTNNVDVAALTCYLAGVLTLVSAAVDKAITRPATAVSKVNSITIDSTGAVAVVAGTDGSTTAFSETRAAAGGPPLIPVGSIEIAQVRVVSNTAAVITAAQIFSTVGTHRERYDYPSFEIDYALGNVNMASALPAIHTGPIAKKVYASYATPVFAEQKFANDFVPAETTHSVSSTQVYGAVVGNSSSSLGQGSFTAILGDGITDSILAKKDDTIWVKYFQDKYKAPYILTRGRLGLSRTFGASDNPKVKCTISASEASIERAS